MTEEELIEQLADKEHASWARWQEYFFSKCDRNPDGSFTVPAGYVVALQKQIETPYAELSEQEKQSDRDEVAHILPIIAEYNTQWRLANPTILDQVELAKAVARLASQVRRLCTEIFSTDMAIGKDDGTEKRRRTLLGCVNDLRDMSNLPLVDYSFFVD